MLNHIDAMGMIVKDPELRRTPNGVAVTSFTIACERDHTGDDAERGVDFLDVIAWRSTAEFVSKYFTKGRKAVVSGRLQIRDWTDKNGNKRRSAEIIADYVYFADSKPDGQAAGLAHNPTVAAAQPSASGNADFPILDDDDDGLPY